MHPSSSSASPRRAWRGDRYHFVLYTLGWRGGRYRAQYSIWATLAAPLVLSADLRTLAARHPACLSMLKNPELLAIARDPLGEAGTTLYFILYPALSA